MFACEQKFCSLNGILAPGQKLMSSWLEKGCCRWGVISTFTEKVVDAAVKFENRLADSVIQFIVSNQPRLIMKNYLLLAALIVSVALPACSKRADADTPPANATATGTQDANSPTPANGIGTSNSAPNSTPGNQGMPGSPGTDPNGTNNGVSPNGSNPTATPNSAPVSSPGNADGAPSTTPK